MTTPTLIKSLASDVCPGCGFFKRRRGAGGAPTRRTPAGKWSRHENPDQVLLVLLADETLEIHEVKGASRGKPFIEDDAAVKVKVIAELVPIPVVMVWPERGGGWNRRVM